MKYFAYVGSIFLLSISIVCNADSVNISSDQLSQLVEKYGPDAKTRVIQWEKLINTNQGQNELIKLKMVNNFFNQITYKSKEDKWSDRNSWLTPIDLLASASGNCEDFSLAKYYTLVKMGVPISKLRVSYVKLLTLNQPHMVLTYYETPTAEPLILDNVRTYILFASERPDLQPVYSFNGDGLWMTKSLNKNNGQRVGESNKMTLWLDWEKRMQQQDLN